jgi:hypothetical protein
MSGEEDISDLRELLTTEEAAEFLRTECRYQITKTTMTKLRVRGEGPPFHKYGSKVRYTKRRLQQYAFAVLSPELKSTSGDVRRRKGVKSVGLSAD